MPSENKQVMKEWYQCHHPSLWYCSKWLSTAEATSLLVFLDQELAWEQPSLTLFGKEHKIPRSQCWMGDSGLTYRYSNKTFHPSPWIAVLSDIRDRINLLLNQMAVTNGWESPRPINSVLVNRYRDGADKMGWHSDDEKELGADPIIASLSLGQPRDMRFRPTATYRSFQMERGLTEHLSPFTQLLEHGSLLIMGPGSQTQLQHEIPQRKKVEGMRINLTFRAIQALPSP